LQEALGPGHSKFSNDSSVCLRFFSTELLMVDYQISDFEGAGEAKHRIII